MEFLLAIIVFGGLLAICLYGYGVSSRSAAALHATGGRRTGYSEPPPYRPEPAARPAETPSHTAVTGEDHPILQADDKPRAAREKPGKLM